MLGMTGLLSVVVSSSCKFKVVSILGPDPFTRGRLELEQTTIKRQTNSKVQKCPISGIW